MTVDDFKVRQASPIDASAIAHAYVATWRTNYRTLLSAATLRRMNELRETLFWWTSLCGPRPGTVTLVIENPTGAVAGFISSGPDRGPSAPHRAEIYTLYVLQPYQRSGLGTRLLAACAARLADLGFTSLVVWVLAGNPARAFYEAHGATAVASKAIRVGDRTVQEVAYLWQDIRAAESAVTSARRGV